MIQISVDTRRAVVTNKELLTVGSAGIQVQFTLSEDWDTLSKLAVFRVGDDGTKVDVVLGESLTCVVPPEVLTQEDEVLFIGIYGANGQGTVIIPTVWASAGVVKPGTEPNTPAESQPTPEIWAQILGVAQDAEQVAGEAYTMAANAQGYIVEETVRNTVDTFVNTTVPAAEQSIANAQTDAEQAVEDKGEEVIASIPEDYTELVDEVDDLSNAIEQLDDLTSENQPHLTNSILNPFEDHFPVKGKYIKNNKGQYGDNANWNTTDYIPIEPGYRYSVESVPDAGYFIAFYDSGKTIKQYFSAFTAKGFSVAYKSTWRYVRISNGVSYCDDFDIHKGNLLVYYGEESFKSTGLYLEVGSDKPYTDLRTACVKAITVLNSTVVVYPGTYDLAQEFATEITNEGTKGIALGNGMKIIFLSGSYVTCLLDATAATHEEFQPFYADTGDYVQNSDFTLDGLVMSASNCRYCVHDEMSQDTRPYKHNYINCQMHFENDFQTRHYIQCIGGGLGVNGYINIDGGYYDSPTESSSTSGSYVAISYHNTANANGDSKIFIKNVYLEGQGHLRFGWYGTSTKITPVYVSGCSFGAPIEKRAENSSALIDNFSIVEWNNTVRT